ncbi:MAG TPA: carboxypeptidase regulatory-like domain-containing protein [Terriglobales bacterium]|nr:carboxypeptidase regulatory-like domain-containing protein [Terriglobales bacterium]
MSRHLPWKLLGCGLAVCLLSPLLLNAEVTASVSGTITDPSGAIVPNAVVILRSGDTGLERKIQANAQGAYEFLAVPVGDNYSVRVEASGFRASVQSGIKLEVNQKYRADFKLTVGAVTATVEVTGAMTQVDTSSTQLGDVIGEKKMTALPLNGRSYLDLLGLQAGVVPTMSEGGNAERPVSGNQKNSGQLSVNGQRESANSFLVNGGDVEESVYNGASIVPTLDSIEEFRLLTNTFNAEYGRFSGAIVNVVTKSGTNEIHGSAYEFLRNEKLDSRGYFDPTRGDFKRNQFGGTLGFPIVKNKLFFFGDYQGTREVRGVSQNQVVPSVLEKTGDFSDLADTGLSEITGTVRGNNGDPNNFPAVLSDRLGYTVVKDEPYWFPGCTSTDSANGCVFPGANGPIIPQSAWSPVAVATLKFLPDPNGEGGTPTFSSTAEKLNLRDEKFGLRVDYNTGHFGNWSGYYNFDDANYLNPYPAFTSNLPGFSAVSLSRAQQAQLSNTVLLNPNTVNEVRLNYTRIGLLRNKPKGGLGKIEDFGYFRGDATHPLGVIPTNSKFEGVAPVSFGQMGSAFGLPDGTTGQYNNTYQIADNFSKIIGKHTLKFGGDIRYIQVNERNTYTSNGWFEFDGGETGNDFADYLLGAPDLFNQTSPQLLDSRTKYFGLYAQDTYRVRDDLTINYGLRWDVSQPFYDTKDRIQTFVPGVQSTVYPDSPTGFVFPKDPHVPRTLAPTQYNRFAPRLGIAYSPGATDGTVAKLTGGPGKTSIRAGAGIYYTAIEDITLFNEVGDAPFGLFWVSPSPVYMEEPYKRRVGQPDPVGNRFPFTIPPAGATGIWPTYLPIAFAPTYALTNKLPYSIQFNLVVQRELPKNFLLSAGYVGSRGRHLLSTVESNPGTPAKCLAIPDCGPFGEDTIYDLGGGNFAFGTRPYSVTSGRELDKTTGVGSLDFQNNAWEATAANSNYNALQIQLQKEVGAFRVLGAYTWSKSIDNSSGFFDAINPFNPELSRALSTFDVTNNFVVSYSYDLPFGKSGHGVAGKLLGGWTISGITRFTTGFPVTLTESDDASLCGCSGADLPKYDGTPIHFMNPRNSEHLFFDPTPFSANDPGTIGNVKRRFFHGPGLNNWDLAFHKATHITERVALEFRGELFNAFNHAQFKNPDGDVNGNIGLVTDVQDPRIGQLALKLSF